MDRKSRLLLRRRCYTDAMSKPLPSVLLAMCLPLASLPAAGRDGACPPARVGISDLGYASYQEGGGYRGASVDVLAEMHRRSGCQFNYEWFPRGRLYAQFNNGLLEMTPASVRTPERDRYGNWLPYAYTQFELLLTNKSAGKFGSLADFVDHSTARLNVTRGISYPPQVMVQMARLEKLGRLEYVNDFGVVFRKILAGRADGTLAPPIIHVLHVRQFGMEGKMKRLTVTESPRVMTGMYLSKALVSEETLHLYADILRGMVADGTVQKIYERYIGEEIGRQAFSGGMREILDALPR